ncbi:DegV family protein [Nocardioides sp.]|uniref:DegV family protein n=1 Tax=Nocardioides sp. TaxID=35761 RepID=UPI0039E66A87
MGVAVVTDSTAMLPAALAASLGITVVPVHVVIDGEEFEDGAEGTTPADIAAALEARKAVSTSRPAPAALASLYSSLAAGGASEIVSVHLSGAMSGTFESAQLAARTAPVPVVALDTLAVGPCLGFAVEAAAAAAAAGASASEAAAAAMDRANASTSYFYVDTLEFLRRGGRIGAAAALLGSALAVKPLLAIEDGRVVARERVRTSARAIARLEELAVEAAGDQQVEVAVAHLRGEERAAALTDHLTERLGDALAEPIRVGELGAALGAHVGPGMLAVCVAPAVTSAP